MAAAMGQGGGNRAHTPNMAKQPDIAGGLAGAAAAFTTRSSHSIESVRASIDCDFVSSGSIWHVNAALLFLWSHGLGAADFRALRYWRCSLVLAHAVYRVALGSRAQASHNNVHAGW